MINHSPSTKQVDNMEFSNAHNSLYSLDFSLMHLLQLCSVNLPVGSFAFSQGLETAVEKQWITNLSQTQDWLNQQLMHGLATLDLPLLIRQQDALKNQDFLQYQYWNQWLLASRETNELRLTDTATGQALIRLLVSLNIEKPDTKHDISIAEYSFVSAFALAAEHWQIPARQACIGFVWSWLENQVTAAAKLVPLGQTQAQQLLMLMQPVLIKAVDHALTLSDTEMGGSLPGLAIASSWHETQYSRLFRS